MPHKESNVEFTPSGYPPFPDDLKTVELKTISLQKIQNADREEQDCMFEECKTRGFFYLDLSQSEQGDTISHGAEHIASVAESVMALPLEEKMKYPFEGKDIFG